MSSEKNTSEKARLHPRNKNRERYDLRALVLAIPALKNYVARNDYGTESINFSNPKAVKLLNQALLKHYYGIQHWDFPDQNLCPPIPGRADYLHHIADLLGEDNFGKPPMGEKIICLDVGLGASCIYPIIGVTEYGWKFMGSDINPKSIKSAQQIVNSNLSIKGMIECRIQKNSRDIFQGIISKEDKIELTICNPPFHSSKEEALQGTRRKVKNLSGNKAKMPELNFAGISNELIYDGGEYRFIERMIKDSQKFSKNCYWFSTLVSKQSNLKGIQQLLERTKAIQVKKIPMGTGNKASRIIAWTFLSADERREWRAA
ncbi:MAG: 23S rRNA (adenine1618-N6)-methyltransferase, partial [Cyclobacteriaceae bacterium]